MAAGPSSLFWPSTQWRVNLLGTSAPPRLGAPWAIKPPSLPRSPPFHFSSVEAMTGDLTTLRLDGAGVAALPSIA
jgi:hypothetical protein